MIVRQSKISSFFERRTESDMKRKGDDEKPQPAAGRKARPAKKARSDVPIEESSSTEVKVFQSGGDFTPLSPEQLQKMCSNHLTAKLRLTAKKVSALHPNMGISWYEALEPEFSKPYFRKLSEFLIEERNRHVVFPKEDHVFTWTRMCDIRKVKVVILGQDPYHGIGQAHGLSFSVQKGIVPPPSLVNMYNELANDISGFVKPSHGNLSGWARQGVLLLNACLTVRAHSANSHKDKGWEQFTDAVIVWLDQNLTGVVFLLWGAYAHKKALMINKARHHILQCPHPSPLSAHRGFLGCRHFSKANQFLIDQKIEPVDWSHLPLDDD